MLERTRLGKGHTPNYDPQVGQAAAANSALAQRAQDFSEKFYNDHISPLLQTQAKSVAANTDQQQKLFDLNFKQANEGDARYHQFGIPAEDRYYNMVNQYSAPEEQERQAGLALGDQRVAEQGQHAQLNQTFGSLGIDPTSPAAMAAMSDRAVQNAAVEASAQNKARMAAKSLGMQLSSDAANFGRGGQSSTLAFGGAASGNSQAGLVGTNQSLGVAQGAGGSVMSGYGLGIQANSNNLNAYSGLQREAMQQQSQAGQGFGSLLGLGLSAALAPATGGAGASFAGNLFRGLTNSDRRLKKNITPITRMSNGLWLYRFDYRDEPQDDGKHVGYMADEVEKKFPEAVVTREDGMKMVNYDKVPL